MSLALHLAADALADLRRLDFWLQEEVLDELDRLAANPGLVPQPIPGWGSIYAFARASVGTLYVLTITVQLSASQLTVLGITLTSANGNQPPVAPIRLPVRSRVKHSRTF